MTDRQRSYRDEIATALLAGVPEDTVAEVVRGYLDEPDVDPLELRQAFMTAHAGGRVPYPGPVMQAGPIAGGLVEDPEEQTAPAE